jgi:hypothetical protein
MKDRKNLEQQLADKLGNRSIAPNGQAWERIAHNRQLGKNKKKKTRVVLYYAASVVLLLLFGSYFFMTENSDTIMEPQVVNIDKTEDTIDVNTTVAVPEVVVQFRQSEVIAADRVVKSTVFPHAYKEEAVMASGPYKELQVKESLSAVGLSAILPDKKALTKEQLSEQEVDYLLKNAVKEVAADKLLSKPTSDTALLKEVESEMDEYYREKAMSIFSLKNKKIRFAVKD